MQNWESQIFDESISFNERALQLFHFQVENNLLYKKYLAFLEIDIQKINHFSQIPFLPIQFFKSHRVLMNQKNASVVFKSSGTTSENRSQHFVADPSLYKLSILKNFQNVFGSPENYEILALLPSYLERKDASLIYMVNYLMGKSKSKSQTYFLKDWQSLENHINNIPFEHPLIIFGASFALLDFCDAGKTVQRPITIIETGGMKGRKKELLKTEVLEKLKTGFPNAKIYSEYGMTELLSQAYAKNGIEFSSPHWMRVLVRKPDDPMEIKADGSGALNVIDLANVYSCAFIATDDLANLKSNQKFSILGRLDNSDIRGCSQLVL